MNAVLVILDSLRKDHVGVYGADRAKTPNLDALAGESLRFTRAYPESVPTLPARRAIHTGMRTWPFRNWVPLEGEGFMPAGWGPIPEDQTTLSERLGELGYTTVLFSDNQHLFKASMNFHRGFAVYEWFRGQERDFYRPATRVPNEEVERFTVPGNDRSMVDKVRQYLANTQDRKGEEDYFAPRVFSRGIEFLDSAEEGAPFLLVVDCFDPHEPWDPPQEYVDMYDDGYEGPEPIVPNYSDAGWISDAELERMRALYAAEVTMTDRWLGRFLDKMESTGRMEDTLLVVVSDHGVALGEHDATGKPFWALYPELTDIPLLVRDPEGRRAGETSDYYASTHDIAPTTLGVLGATPSVPPDGRDLSVLLGGGQLPPRDHFTLGYDDYVQARDDRYVLLSRNDRSEARLFDAQDDPNMENDVAADKPGVVRRMFDEYVLGDAGGSLPRY